MSVEVIAELVPKNNGTFPTHLSKYGKGGWHEVSTLAERDAIPLARRSSGMACNVGGSTIYILGSDLSTWREATFTGISDAPTDGQQYARKDGAWVPVNTNLDGGIYA